MKALKYILLVIIINTALVACDPNRNKAVDYGDTTDTSKFGRGVAADTSVSSVKPDSTADSSGRGNVDPTGHLDKPKNQ